MYTIIVIISVLVIGCGSKENSTKNISIHPNLESPKNYIVKVELWADGSDSDIRVLVKKNNKIVSELQLFNTPISIKLVPIVSSLPFHFISGENIKGILSLTPSEGFGPTFQLPVDVYIEPWIAQNIWIIYCILGIISVLFLANYSMMFLKTAARGKVNFVIPMSGPWYIYPPSRIIHFNRDKYFIGTGSKDNIPSSMKGEKGKLKSSEDEERFHDLLHSHFKLKFKKDRNHRKKIIAQLVSFKSFYIKEGNLEIRTFTKDENLDATKLELSGFIYKMKYTLKQNILYTIIVSSKLVFKIEIT